jgi:hypothetical protein
MVELFGLLVFSSLVSFVTAMLIKLAAAGRGIPLRFSGKETITILLAAAIITAVLYFALPDVQ